ncbi:hypothetical protein E8E11_010396 [Didymella keratinophila]|nr:hypothetical protein E8E11_010396 [Didymella keratinophila]
MKSYSSSEEEEESLADRLTNKSVQSQFDKTPHRFVPERFVKNLITAKSVHEVLYGSCKELDEEDESLIQYVLGHARRLFAIVVLTEFQRMSSTRKAMFLFMKHCLTDEHLPFDDLPSEPAGDAEDDCAMDVSGHQLGRMSKGLWSQAKIRKFWQEQWKLLAPILDTDKDNQDFGIQTMPFIDSGDEASEGSFGFVRQYTIHPDHVRGSLKNTLKNCGYVVAVKAIKKQGKNDREKDPAKVANHWASEANALAKMNSLNQDHIVRFITAFRRCLSNYEEHYLVFEWADGGNLHDLWNSIPKPRLEPLMIKAAIQQLSGLAAALRAAHNLDANGASYRHGDLKPANILWFHDGTALGKLKIGDWGEAKAHNLLTELRPVNTTAEFGTRRYEPPEVETGLYIHFLGQAPRRRSRLYDVWAMGCITLEFIVWLLYGVEKLKEFNRSSQEKDSPSSPFYKILSRDRTKVAEVHHEVVRWMSDMAGDAACQSKDGSRLALGDLLDVVKNELLVVKLPQRTSPPARNFSGPFPIGDYEQAPASIQQDGLTVPVVREPLEMDASSGDEVPLIAVTPAETEKTNNDTASLPPAATSPEPRGSTRATAVTFCTSLEKISSTANESYWTVDHTQRSNSKPPTGALAPLSPEDTGGGAHPSAPARISGLRPPVSKKLQDLNPDTWDLFVDNNFASLISQDLIDAKKEEKRIAGRLCAQCRDLHAKIPRPSLDITYDISELRRRAQQRECDLCILLWLTCQRHDAARHKTVRFERDQSSLKLNGIGLRVLSIFTPFGSPTKPKDLQIGFAELPDVGSSAHYNVLRRWLEDCDTNHIKSKCRLGEEEPRYQTNPSTKLPTRLIDVGRVGDIVVNLWEPRPGDKGMWLALSHPWGDAPHFSTNRKNYERHLKGMALETLPQTFKDAIYVTRALGFRYLWIDSLCIIQGDDGDFQQESTRMEEVYSGASCVIAASCSTGHYSGFLKPRLDREYVTLSNDTTSRNTYHICQHIDDFNDHVLNGPLNRRGWVLQEHALARRTIFFTKHQTYWECGHGVRCESMTYMRSNSAALLGDPNFPRILNAASHGERIIRCQDLYKRYSRLGLAQPYDRPTAIDGMQQRLLRTMDLEGGFGVFDEGNMRGLLRRSLLWRRPDHVESLGRIKFPVDRGATSIPTWSWMAYDGPIDYLDLDFGRLDWADLISPWSPERRPNTTSLLARVSKYTVPEALKGDISIILDTPGASGCDERNCVILGTQKDGEEKIHYVLFVAAFSNKKGEVYYERIGTGSLHGRCILGAGSLAHIF